MFFNGVLGSKTLLLGLASSPGNLAAHLPAGIHYEMIGNINSRLKGAVDRELRGEYIRFFPNVRTFWILMNVAQNIFLVRVLRIRPVQSVVNSPTQLFGRGFPRISHMKLVLSQHHVFLVLQNGRRAVQFENLQF